MRHKLAHQPKYEQNTGNTKKHIDLLRCLLAAAHANEYIELTPTYGTKLYFE